MNGGDAGEIQAQRRDQDECILLVLPFVLFLFFYYYILYYFHGGKEAPGQALEGFFLFCFFCFYVFGFAPPPPSFICLTATTSTRPVFDHPCHCTACSTCANHTPVPPSLRLLVCDGFRHPPIMDQLIIRKQEKKKTTSSDLRYKVGSLFTLDSVKIKTSNSLAASSSNLCLTQCDFLILLLFTLLDDVSFIDLLPFLHSWSFLFSFFKTPVQS